MNRRTHLRRGFTLIELMISLVMGLIIALAAVGLARSATTTFYEQARISGVEANVRAASERLRNDLSRVSYMSTPNIHWDPRVSRTPQVLGSTPYRITALQNLQGLRLAPAAIRTHALETKNSLTPHDVFIAGNLTSDDVYRGQFVADVSSCGGGSAQIRLNADADPAVRRLFNGATTSAARQQMTQLVFTPGERMVPAQTGFSYAVQVMDMRGCYNYMTICAVIQSARPNEVLLDLAGDATSGILTPANTGGDVCGARVMEEVAIAPIQRVRWSLAAETDTRRLDPVIDVEGALTKKLNLERQVLAADGTTTIGPAEVIAEYAVDLKLGLFVDPSPGTPNPTNIDFEAADTTFASWTGPVTGTTTTAVGPHRIRSVRYRLAFRTSFPDRRADLAMPSGPPYISRYCTKNVTPCTDYARVRTVISEVALMNQKRNF
ncbi:MAG TPA: prepilin-type N-terminal cleavage/methylation domain-containing protein [Labilithrix sp.]|nr:prepilin-type N-terminal cleavage/methylation domain-containing protein [Labilithrix sp.]